MTNQGTETIYTVEDIVPGAQWRKFAEIDHSALPSSLSPPYYHVEDPFMWIDGHGNWHIINHADKNGVQVLREKYGERALFQHERQAVARAPGHRALRSHCTIQ